MSAQQDLFGDMPTAKAPPKSDTPLLLAMDSDYVTGAPDEDEFDYFDELELCTACAAPTDDGEGWNGLCGHCADVADREPEQ